MVNHNVLLGIAWALLFSFCAIISDGTVRYVTMHGFPSSEMLFMRCFLGTWLLLPFVLKNRVFHDITKKTLTLYGLRGTLACMAVATWFYILKYTDFTALIAIGCTAPLFTAMLSLLFLKEKASWIKILALATGFFGAMVVINPMGITFNGYLVLGLASAFAWAVSMVVTKQLSRNEHPVTVAFFLALVLTPLSFLLALPVWQWPTPREWGFILFFTGTGTLGQIALAKAFSHADLTTLMPFEFSQLIFAALFAYIVFGDTVTLNTFLGGIVIFASGYIIVRSERKKHRLEDLQIVP